MALENRDKSFPPHPLKLRLLPLSFFSSVALEASPLQHKFLNDTELALRSLRRTINDGVQALQTNNPSAPPPSPRIRPFASSFPVARLFRSFEFFFAAATFVPRNKFWNSFQQHLGVGSFLYRSFHSLVVHSYIFSYCPLLFLSGDDDGDGSRKVLWMKINLWPAPTFAKRGASLNIFVSFPFFLFFGQFTSLCAQLLPISRTIFFGDF